MAGLVQVAAVEPQRFLLRRLPNVAQLAFPRAGVLGGVGAEAPALADFVGDVRLRRSAAQPFIEP